MNTIFLARHEAFERIKRVTSDAAQDIDLLLAHSTGRDCSWLLAHGEAELAQEQQQTFLTLIERRRRHEPAAYLVGAQEFYGRRFFVDKNVLIPRPESELIIDALRRDFTGRTNLDIIDVGTGSGCLAISAALLFPGARIIATDISADALAVAQKNSKNLRAANISFLPGNLLAPLLISGKKADAIMANLPYLSSSDIAASPTREELSFEPGLALLADDDGLALIKACTRQSVDILRRGGKLYLEMMPRQTKVFLTWLNQGQFPYSAEITRDLAGHERLVTLTKSC